MSSDDQDDDITVVASHSAEYAVFRTRKFTP